jgi:hypothetical protein
MPHDEIRDQARPGRGPGPARGTRAGQGGRLVRAARRVAAVATGRSWNRILTAAGAAVGVAAAVAGPAPSALAQPPYAYGAALAQPPYAYGPAIAAPYACGAAIAAIAVADGNTVIAVQTPSDALMFYWNEYGTNTWHAEQVAASGTTFSAPTMAPDGDGVIIAAQGPRDSLDFYWQTNGTAAWHPELVGSAGTTYSAPAITANDGSANIAANGPGGLDFYWQANGTTAWHPELITTEDPGDNAAPSITTMNHGSGDGVCVLAPYLAEYCAINGTATWQAYIPCQPNCQLLAGSDPVITENNGSDNIAIFSVLGDLLFYWDDSSGGHEELVAPDVT